LWTTQNALFELYVDAKNKLYSKTHGTVVVQRKKMEQTPKPMETAKPKSRTMVLAIIIVVILVVVGVGIYILTRAPPPANNGTPVSIFDGNPTCSPVTPPNCGFNPSTLTLKMGVNNTVTWTNKGGQAHTVTSNSTTNGSLPSFNSNGINSNAQYTFTFPQAGTYHYYCAYHVWMQAVVVVAA
jgi:plastocyanin